jgi:hypothetical protein
VTQPHTFPDDSFIVICLDDDGAYVLATRQVFRTRLVADAYAAGISSRRQPYVIAGRWDQLRFGNGW